jgi:hypothetical protein
VGRPATVALHTFLRKRKEALVVHQTGDNVPAREHIILFEFTREKAFHCWISKVHKSKIVCRKTKRATASRIQSDNRIARNIFELCLVEITTTKRPLTQAIIPQCYNAHRIVSQDRSQWKGSPRDKGGQCKITLAW